MIFKRGDVYNLQLPYLQHGAMNYLNDVECAECRHRCCTRVPGCLFPEDVKEPLEKCLREMLRSRLWQVDYLAVAPGDFYLRPARKGATKRLIDPMWWGECIFLGDKGCHLASLYRPTGCRRLEPNRSKGCIYHPYSLQNPKEDAAAAWHPHQLLLKDIIKDLKKGRDLPDHLSFMIN